MIERLHLKWLACALIVAGTAAAVTARRNRSHVQLSTVHKLKSVWMEVDGVHMHARQAVCATNTHKTPLVLVHGWGVSGSYFVPSAERLAAEFNVYVPDLPGHGLSGSPARSPDIAGLAQWLIAWMNRAGIRNAVLIGHSMGCQTVVETALRSPDRVNKIVLIGPTLDPELRHNPELVFRLLLAGMYERPSILGHVAKDYLRMGWRLLPECLAMMRDPIEEKLPKIQIPSMLVRGEKDTLVPQRWFDEAVARLRSQHSPIISGWGHAVQYSAPQQLVSAIRPFLENT